MYYLSSVGASGSSRANAFGDCEGKCSIQVLQGTTTAPGLIFYERLPRRLQMHMRWLASYVALSRVRPLKQLCSVGLGQGAREIIEQGPLKYFTCSFPTVVCRKVATRRFADQFLLNLGW